MLTADTHRHRRVPPRTGRAPTDVLTPSSTRRRRPASSSSPDSGATPMAARTRSTSSSRTPTTTSDPTTRRTNVRHRAPITTTPPSALPGGHAAAAQPRSGLAPAGTASPSPSPTGSTPSTRPARRCFDVVADDYAEVWVVGEMPHAFRDAGGHVAVGFNAPNRVLLTNDALPGQQLHRRVGINNPISVSPRVTCGCAPRRSTSAHQNGRARRSRSSSAWIARTVTST
jgi:hypothetical protein